MSALSREMDDVRTAVAHHLTPGYLLSDFISVLAPSQIKQLERIDARRAVTSGAFVTREEYENVKFQELVEMEQDGIPALRYQKLVAVGEQLESILLNHSIDGGCANELSLILKALKPFLTRPDFCAQTISKKAFHEVSLASLLREADTLLQDVRALDEDGELDRTGHSSVGDFAKFCKHSRDSLELRWELLEYLHKKAQVKERHGLITNEYSFCLADEPRRLIYSPIEILIMESRNNPRLLFKMSPRSFEQLIAQIFRGFGYEVDLTCQTRDGGVDVICLSSKDDASIRVALEVKRYKEKRPITVQLVRSFVGANALIRSEKLVYVTTSRYTKDAHKYANSPFLASMLELKSLPDVIRWCNEYSPEKLARKQSIRHKK